MTHEEVKNMLERSGLPLAYDHFAEGESLSPPFLVFLFPGSDNYSADGLVYKKIETVHAKLYTDEKDPGIEKRIEDIFDDNDIFYDKTEVWIESEKLYEVLYSFEILKEDSE